MKVSARHLTALLGLAWVLVAGQAAAWAETHLVSHDIRIEVERSGQAVIDHAMSLRIRGGPLRSFDLLGADKDAAPLPDSTVISAKAEGPLVLPVPLEVAPRPDGALRVNIDLPRGLSHGTFLFHVRYRKNLLADGIRRDGAMLRIRWAGPTWPEGVDNERCTFVIPSAPTEPRAGSDRSGPDQAQSDDFETEAAGALVSEVRRFADRDEVELVRPHVARMEAVSWSIRVDPRAFGGVGGSEPRASGPTSGKIAAPPEERAIWIGIACAIAALFSALVALKARQVRSQTLAAGLRPRPLLPIGAAARSALSGPALAAGVALQLRCDDPLWGTLSVLLAMALTWYLQPRYEPRPRGPGQWFLLTDAEAFRSDPPDRRAFLDAGTRTGRMLLGLALVGAAACAWAIWPLSRYGAYLVIFDSTVVLPLFGTGGSRDLPPDPLSGPGPLLARIARRLRRHGTIRALGWARLPHGADHFDELRLIVAPRLPRRGLSAIEIGLAAAPGMGGFFQLPEILVRVIDASPCHEAFRRLLPGARWIRGRKADERVVALRPRLPTVQMTAALARRLADHARDEAPGQPPSRAASARARAAAA